MSLFQKKKQDFDISDRLTGRNFVDLDNFNMYKVINEKPWAIWAFCLIIMMIELLLLGTISSLGKFGFEINFGRIISQGFKTTSTYIFWGTTLMFFTGVFLIRFKKNPNKDEERNYLKSQSGVYGTSDWMGKKEFDTFLKLTSVKDTVQPILGEMDGKVVSIDENCDPKNQLNPHTFILGASGSRKTRTYVFNAAFQAIRRGESMIFSDPKGELYENLREILKNNGYEVKCFNLKEPRKSDCWDVLSEARTAQGAQTLCDVIIKNTGEGKGDFFDNAELNLLKALCLFIKSSKKHKEMGLSNIGGVYDSLIKCNDEEKIQAMVGDYVDQHPNHPAFKPYKIYEGAGKVKNNIIVGLGSRMNLFQNTDYCEICSNSDIEEKNISLTAPMDRKCAYFVITSDQESSAQVLSSLFFSFLFIELVNYYDKNKTKTDFNPLRVNFIMDEFINIGSIPDIDKKITTVRSRGISMAMIVQNIGQLKDKYKFNWEAIISNCDTTLILSVGKSDITSAKWVSDILDTQTVETVSNVQSYSKLDVLKYSGQFKETRGIGKRALMTPGEVASMSRDDMLVIIAAHQPMKLKKFDYSKHFMYEQIQVIEDEVDEEQYIEEVETEMYVNAVDEIDRRRKIESIQNRERYSKGGSNGYKRRMFENAQSGNIEYDENVDDTVTPEMAAERVKPNHLSANTNNKQENKETKAKYSSNKDDDVLQAFLFENEKNKEKIRKEKAAQEAEERYEYETSSKNEENVSGLFFEDDDEENEDIEENSLNELDDMDLTDDMFN